MRNLVRKIVYRHTEDYVTDNEEKRELLEWINNKIEEVEEG